mmetsp:Transcript_31352/g.55114  ORF Transcript_31352/g.55114 Transcript_31352/m.55114 type:complete len:468 (+) Transcript_31352:225-1628(+)
MNSFRRGNARNPWGSWQRAGWGGLLVFLSCSCACLLLLLAATALAQAGGPSRGSLASLLSGFRGLRKLSAVQGSGSSRLRAAASASTGEGAMRSLVLPTVERGGGTKSIRWAPVRSSSESKQLRRWTAMRSAVDDGEILGSEAVVAERSDELDTAKPPMDSAPLWMLLVSAMLLGSSYATTKATLNTHIDPAVFMTLRFGAASLLLLPLLTQIKNRKAWLGALECGAYNMIGYFAGTLALEYTTADKTSFLCSLYVVIVQLLNGFLNKKVDLKGWVAAAIVLGGITLLEEASSSAPNMGDAIALIQPLAFAINYLRVEYYTREYPEDVLGIAAVQPLAVFLLCLFITEVESKGHPVLDQLSDPSVIQSIAYIGFAATGLKVLLSTYALSKVPATQGSVILASSPLWAAIIASQVLGEQMGPADTLGGMLMVSGCLVYQLWDPLIAPRLPKSLLGNAEAAAGDDEVSR